MNTSPKITNKQGIPLPMAVWAVLDDYDYCNDPNYISATGLMKPLRHIVLKPRVEEDNWYKPDVSDKIASAFGSTLHNSIENAWKDPVARSHALKLLGYSDEIINSIVVNPTPDQLYANCIPIYLEKRTTKAINGYTIGGKFDMVAEGKVQDYKSTSAFSWMYGTRDEDHILQGSIYRWLNPDIITEDTIIINYFFTDWQRSSAKSNPNYPDSRIKSKELPLMSLEDTEAWIVNKLAEIDRYLYEQEAAIPLCTEAELWMSDPVYKYYSDPNKTSGRSTKNFDSYLEATEYLAAKKKGLIKTSQSLPKRCGYCPVYSICTQKDAYFAEDDWQIPSD